MRQLRYVDYDCQNCRSVHTRFVYFDTELERPDDEEQRCDVPLGEMTPDGPSVYDTATPDQVAVCQGVLAPREMSGIGYMKTITKGNGDFSERERDRLEKRADDHWKRQGRDEAIARERMVLKKHGAVGGVR